MYRRVCRSPMTCPAAGRSSYIRASSGALHWPSSRMDELTSSGRTYMRGLSAVSATRVNGSRLKESVAFCHWTPPLFRASDSAKIRGTYTNTNVTTFPAVHRDRRLGDIQGIWPVKIRTGYPQIVILNKRMNATEVRVKFSHALWKYRRDAYLPFVGR